MPVDVKQYLEQLAQTAGLSDEDKANLMKVAGNEKVAKSLGDDILRQADYSRNLDALRADRQKWEKWYADSLQWRADEEARLAALTPTTPITPVSTFDAEGYKKLLMEEVNKKTAAQEGQFIGLLKTGLSLVGRHMKEFNEPLDVDALAKVAVEKQQSLDAAYADLVSPRRAEAQKAKYEADLKAARDAGAREFASTHKIPIDTMPREHHPLLDKPTQGVVTDYTPNSGRLTPTSERSLRDSFVAEWEKEGAHQASLERVGTSGS